MRRGPKRALLLAALVAGLAGGTTAIATAGAGDDDATDTAITGAALDKAKAAALEEVGEGRVTETEAGDEESYYEVEVTREDGSQVDVQLDRGFRVVGSEDERGDDG